MLQIPLLCLRMFYPGFPPTIIADFIPDVHKKRGCHYYTTVPLRDADRKISGYLSVYYQPALMQQMLMPGGTQAFTCTPDDDLNGKDALDYGLKEGDLRNNICRFVRLNGTGYSEFFQNRQE